MARATSAWGGRLCWMRRAGRAPWPSGSPSIFLNPPCRHLLPSWFRPARQSSDPLPPFKSGLPSIIHLTRISQGHSSSPRTHPRSKRRRSACSSSRNLRGGHGFNPSLLLTALTRTRLTAHLQPLTSLHRACAPRTHAYLGSERLCCLLGRRASETHVSSAAQQRGTTDPQHPCLVQVVHRGVLLLACVGKSPAIFLEQAHCCS